LSPHPSLYHLGQIRHARWTNAADKGGWRLRKLGKGNNDELECLMSDSVKVQTGLEKSDQPVFSFHRRQKTDEEKAEEQAAMALWQEEQNNNPDKKPIAGSTHGMPGRGPSEVEMLREKVIDHFTFSQEKCIRVGKEQYEDAVERARGKFREHHEL
jgi:hypothetical protein